MMKILALAVLLAVPAAVSAAPVPVPFPNGKACVAWKTRKTMFFVKKLEPVGVNCAVTAKVESSAAGARVIVTVPIAAFDSGEPARDKEVLHILKADAAPSLVFTSRLYTSSEWASVQAGKTAVIDGTLSIGGRGFAVSAPVTLSADAAPAVSGVLVTTFSYFNIKPPVIAGGVVAKVQDYLELHYSIPLSAVAK